MTNLYPLKFDPIVKDKIWGGKKLSNMLNKNTSSDKAGESWEISAVEGDLSVVSNGFLKGNNLQEIVEIYMGDLVGDKVYLQFGMEFPLLIKFIDATDDLSIQVHPNDELAKKRHKSYGKTEMWYVVHAEEYGKLIIGFNRKVNEQEYLKNLKEGTLESILNTEHVKQGDVYFLPAGRVHAICAGLLLAEIQQTSDVTYRIFDYNRVDEKGNHRELHTDLARAAIDYRYVEKYKTDYEVKINESSQLIQCKYFTTNLIRIDETIEKDYIQLDSFVIYMCIDGQLDIHFEGGQETLKRGETTLIPAVLKNIKLFPKVKSELLEIYIS